MKHAPCRWTVAPLGAVGARLCVRINSLHDDGPLDLAHVVPARPDFVAYPKTATASDMRALDRAITTAEEQAGFAPGSTASSLCLRPRWALVNVREIAAASPRIRYALLGAEDLAADLMAERSREAVELDYARRRFVLECRAGASSRSMRPTPSPMRKCSAGGAVRTQAGLPRQEPCAFPTTPAAIVAALIPGEAEMAQAQRMVAAFEAARARGEGRALVDGLLVECPPTSMPKRLLALGAASGADT